MRLRTLRLVVTFALGILVGPVPPQAQQPTKVPTVGMLIPVPPADAAINIEAFRQGLRELGYVPPSVLVRADQVIE